MADRVEIVDKKSAEVKRCLLNFLTKIDKIDSLLTEQTDLNAWGIGFSWAEFKDLKFDEIDSYLDSAIQQLEYVNQKGKQNEIWVLKSKL